MENVERSIEEGLLVKNKDQNDDGECRITACVILSTFVTVCASFSFGVSGGYTSGAELGIMEDLGLSIAQFSVFGSLFTVGAAIGALFSGEMAMMIGRKKTLWVSDFLCVTGWLSIGFAKNVMWLNIGRTLTGIGVGFLSYVVPVYVAEIAPKHVRGKFTFSNQLLQNCGLSMIFFCGNFVNWRTMALLGALPCFIQAIGLFFVPESPRWLAKIGMDKEVETSLHRLRGRDVDISREASEIQLVTKMIETDSRSSLGDLFQKKYRLTLVVGIGLMFIQQLCGSGAVISYASTIFRKAGFSVAIGTTILGLVMVPKSMMGLFLVDKWGRRPLLLTSTIGMSITCILIGASFTLQEMELLPGLTPILVLICLTLYVATFAIGLGGLPWIIMSEIFPIHIKVTAGSIVTLASWTSSSVVTYAFNFLFLWSAPGTFYIFGGVVGAATIFIWFLVPETRGLSLEQIQASLTLRDQVI